jgi:hypothetical protein
MTCQAVPKDRVPGKMEGGSESVESVESYMNLKVFRSIKVFAVFKMFFSVEAVLRTWFPQ